jgi:hypothetical protein
VSELDYAIELMLLKAEEVRQKYNALLESDRTNPWARSLRQPVGGLAIAAESLRDARGDRAEGQEGK